MLFPSISRTVTYGNESDQTPLVLTVPGSTNTKGAWLQLVSATAFDAHGIIVQLRASSQSSRTYLADIGVGGSGSETVKIPNLFVTHGGSSHTAYYHFPIFIPAGTRLSGRYQVNSLTSPSCRTSVILYQASGPCPTLSRVRAYGATTADSGGIAVTSGASNVEGSWTQITASTDIDVKAFIVATSHSGGDYSLSASLHNGDIGIGASSSEKAILTNLSQSAVNNFFFPITFGTFPYAIPAGTRLSARSVSDIASPDVRDFIIYGIG